MGGESATEGTEDTRTISIEELRGEKKLADLLILRKGNRLSVTPLAEEQLEAILALE